MPAAPQPALAEPPARTRPRGVAPVGPCAWPSQSFPLPLDVVDQGVPDGPLFRGKLLGGGIAGLMNVHSRRMHGFESIFEAARRTPPTTALVVIETTDAPDPWLGRWVDRHGLPDHPLQAITIGDRLSPSLASRENPVASVPAFAQDGYELKPTARIARTLPSNLRLAARLLAAGLGIRILTTRYTGELTGLTDTFDAFRDDLAARGIGEDVIAVINTATSSAAIRQQTLTEWLS